MSKLLRETLLEKSKHDNYETLTSEIGFFETFITKRDSHLDFRNVNIKLRSSPAYNYKCLNKVHEAAKYKGKIIFPIIETIIIDKGQINHWIFTDETAGYVLKKNSNRLVKDYILKYFVGIALEKITENGKIINKKVDRIMDDIYRFVILSDQNYNAKKEFIGEFQYLEDFDDLNFIYLKFVGNVEKMVNVFDLFNLLGDANKTSNLLLIQNFVNVDKTKTIYCKFQRKNLLGPKKFKLFTKIPNTETEFDDMSNADNNANAKASFGHNQQKSQFSHSGINSNNNNNNVNHLTNISPMNNNNNNITNSPSINNINNLNLNYANISSNNLNGSSNSFNNNINNNNNNTNNNLVNNSASHKNTHSKSNYTLGNLNAAAKKQKKKVIAQNDEEEEKVKKLIETDELIPLNDHNLTEYISAICEPFVELLEKSLGILIYEVFFMFHKDFVGNFQFRLCDNILCKSRITPEELEEEHRLKETMKSIVDKTIPKEIRKNVRKYEKVTKNAFCFGEFCNYNIPKFFKNMSKFNKDDLIEYKNIDSKLIERNKNHDFAFILPYFIIKKAYDNENLVNIVLKAYSIFPKNFDRDQVLLQLQREKQLEEEKKEEENKKEAERLKMEEKIKRMGTAATNNEEIKNFLMNEKKIKNTASNNLNKGNNEVAGNNNGITAEAKHPSISGILKRKTSSSNLDKKKENVDYRALEKNILSQNIDDSEEEDNDKAEDKKSGVTLYAPTPGKFLNFNFDKMYSKTHVCGNCNIIYMLIEDFLCNFEEGKTHFKSLNKAKNLLLQGEKLRNPFNMGDNIDVDENNDNLLFREEKTAFSLKKILRKKIREEKYNEMMKNKPFVHQKIFKKVVTKKDEFKKLFDYNIKMNPKLLQLNLLAEKSKNKFFNLILNELKNDPKTLNEKMGMQKPKRGFPKSLESLRMHMGINSKIMINSEYKALLNLNSAKQRPGSKDTNNILSDRLSAYRKNSNDNKNNNINAWNLNNIVNNSFNLQEIDIFQEYMKIKLNYKPEIKRLKSQVLETNKIKNFSAFKKIKSDKAEQEMSELELAFLKNRKNSDHLSNINEIKEQEAEKEIEPPYNLGLKSSRKNDNQSNNSNNNNLDDRANSSDSKGSKKYKKNIDQNDDSYNEQLSGNEEGSDLNNNIDKDLLSQNNQERILYKNRKINTLNIDLDEYEKYKSKLSIKGKNINADSYSLNLKGNLKQSQSGTYALRALNSLEDKGIERKHSIENEKSKRRISLITYKKSLQSLEQLNQINIYQDAAKQQSKMFEQTISKNNGNFEVIHENKNDNSFNKKGADINLNNDENKQNKSDYNIKNENTNNNNNNKIKSNLSLNSNINKECDKILMNIYDYFFPNLYLIDPSRNRHNNNKLKNLKSTEEQINSLAELTELRHYVSDTDINKMRKFVYEKLENIQKEVILKPNFTKYKKDKESMGLICHSSNNFNSDENLDGNLADEEEENSNLDIFSKGQNNKYLSDNNIHSLKVNNLSDLNQIGSKISFNNNEANSDSMLFKENHLASNKNGSFALNKQNGSNRISNLNADIENEIEVEKNFEKSSYKKLSTKPQEFSKKSYITSIFYYDWAKDPKKYEVPYYFFTTPLMRLNENNLTTVNNPLDEMKTMNFDDLIKIGKFNFINISQLKQKILKKSKVFVYDQNTAIPYLITDLRYLNHNENKNINSPKNKNKANNLNNNSINNNVKDSVLYPNINKTNSNNDKNPTNLINDLKNFNNQNNLNSEINFNNNNVDKDINSKKVKILVVVINDFFDCFTNHLELITNALGVFKTNAERFKIVNFNLPAQPFTLYNKKTIFNNIYYSKFLDRFLFSLMEKNVFDHTYSIVFLGFGNGGHIALKYVAANEKFFDFLNSVIMLNSYCENDENIGKSMLEISKVIENSKNENMIDFFIKSITYNPFFLSQFNYSNINKKVHSGLISNNNITNLLPNIDSKNAKKINNQNYDYNYSHTNNNFANEITNEDIINKINDYLPMTMRNEQLKINYSNYNTGNIANANNNNIDMKYDSKENITNIKDLNNLNFQRNFEKNIMNYSSEDSDIKLNYQGYSLITKGYFYNIPFDFSEINTPIIAFHTSNNCFIPLNNLNGLFINSYASNFDFAGLNNFAVKDPRSTMSPISSMDDFSEINPENKVRRKLVVTEGAHNLIRENPATLTIFLRNFFNYSFENNFKSNQN